MASRTGALATNSAEHDAAKGHPRARARPMFLLFAPDLDGGAVPGPRRAAGGDGVQFLPQPGLELHRMQLAERRKAGRRFSPPPLPRGPLERPRTRRPPPRARRPRLRQAPPFAQLTACFPFLVHTYHTWYTYHTCCTWSTCLS